MARIHPCPHFMNTLDPDRVTNIVTHIQTPHSSGTGSLRLTSNHPDKSGIRLDERNSTNAPAVARSPQLSQRRLNLTKQRKTSTSATGQDSLSPAREVTKKREKPASVTTVEFRLCDLQMAEAGITLAKHRVFFRDADRQPSSE
jgi:hypothetical protein